MSRSEFDVEVTDNMMVAMRDGVCLACDLYMPAHGGKIVPGKWPVVLERTPYSKQREDLVATARKFASCGYVHILQDCRGRFNSEGTHHRTYEPNDGYDTIEWIAVQLWCNGKIGTVGLSYSAVNQGSTGAMNPPHLSAMIPAQGFSFMQRVRTRFGGAYSLSPVVRQFRMINTSLEARMDPTIAAATQENMEKMREWMMCLPYRQGHSPFSIVPSYEQPILEYAVHHDWDPWWKHPGYDVSDYWEQYADIPILLIGGWYDSHTSAVLEAYDQLLRHKKGPVRLIMGPWKHGGKHLQESFAGDVDFGPDSPLDYDGTRLRFFNHDLKDKDTDLNEEAPIKIFIMGGGSGRKNAENHLDHGGYWRNEYEWPIRRACLTPFYLHGGGGLSTKPPANNTEVTTYQHDPKDPVPTIGGPVSAAEELMPAGGYNQCCYSGLFGAKNELPLASRPDVCVFQTELLSEDLEVTGALEIVLYVSSDCPDTDFTAKLLDVYSPNPDYPHGYALNIQDGIIRMRYRNRTPNEEFMEANCVYKVRVEIFATSNIFKANHRIRLDISSSNFPRFDVNPNTGDPLWQERRWRVATNRIYHNINYPSHIVLPIIPSS